MKVYFASLTDPTIEVDAWVPTLEQGLLILKSLAQTYADHEIIMRARLKRFRDYEERTVMPGPEELDRFFRKVEHMGEDEPGI